MKLTLISITIFLLALNTTMHKPTVSITFDDGLTSQYLASKTLDAYGFKGTFYIPAGLQGETFENNTIMNYAQLQELNSRGHEIGCHTMTHANLSALNESIARWELSECVNALNEFKPVSFAYPYGQGSEWEYVIRQYYTSARTIIQESNKEKTFSINALILVHERIERLETLKEMLKSNDWIVLTIHGVTENPRGLIDITPEELIQTLNIIKESGASVKTIKEVMQA